MFSILRPGFEIISACGEILKKLHSSDDMLHLIDEEDSLASLDFGCVNNLNNEGASNVDRELEITSKSCNIPVSIPSIDQRNYFVVEEHAPNLNVDL